MPVYVDKRRLFNYILSEIIRVEKAYVASDYSNIGLAQELTQLILYKNALVDEIVGSSPIRRKSTPISD